MEMSEAKAPRGKVTVICTQSCKEALIELVPVFEREKGFALDVTYGGGPNLAQQIRGGLRADIFVGPEEFSGPLIQAGHLDGNTRTAFAHSSAAFAVKAGTPKPDISSPQKLKEALLAAKAVSLERVARHSRIPAPYLPSRKARPGPTSARRRS